MWVNPPARWLMRASIPPHVCLQSAVLLSRLNNLIVWQSLTTLKDVLVRFLQTENTTSMSPSIAPQANRKDFLCKDSESVISFEFSSFSSSPATAQSFDAIECLSVVVRSRLITLPEINVHTGLNPPCCALWCNTQLGKHVPRVSGNQLMNKSYAWKPNKARNAF